MTIEDVTYKALESTQAAAGEIAQQLTAQTALTDASVPIGQASADALALTEIQADVAAAAEHLQRAYQMSRELTVIPMRRCGAGTCNNQGC